MFWTYRNIFGFNGRRKNVFMNSETHFMVDGLQMPPFSSPRKPLLVREKVCERMVEPLWGGGQHQVWPWPWGSSSMEYSTSWWICSTHPYVACGGQILGRAFWSFHLLPLPLGLLL